MRRVVCFVLAAGIAGSAGVSAKELPSYIPAKNSLVLSQWPDQNRPLRVATDEDCQCAEEIAEMRNREVYGKLIQIIIPITRLAILTVTARQTSP
jgi:hypothetical protein